jgi:putative restriction endonuclease
MQLLIRHAPDRKHLHPEYPFWRLEDEIWEVIPRSGVKLRKGHSDPPKSELIRVGAKGGFTEPLWRELQHDPQFGSKIAAVVLHAYFPGRVHGDVAGSVGLRLPEAWLWPLSLPPDLAADTKMG